MKKIFALTVLVVFLAGAAQAVSLASIGYIDVQKIFSEYKETSKAQDQLKKEEADFKEEFESSQKKIEEGKKNGKSAAELEKLTKKLEEDLAPKREKLLRMTEQLTVKLQNEIVEAVKGVSKNLGLEMVLDKQVIIVGGLDITDMVITKLNKK